MSEPDHSVPGRAVVVGIEGPYQREDGRTVVVLTLTVMADDEPPFRSRVEAPAICGIAAGEHVAVVIHDTSRRVELAEGPQG